MEPYTRQSSCQYDNYIVVFGALGNAGGMRLPHPARSKRDGPNDAVLGLSDQPGMLKGAVPPRSAHDDWK